MRGIAIIVLAMLALLAGPGARADEIEVRDARLELVDEGIALTADFAFEFNPRLAEAVRGGVPLYFVVEFELTRPRWWWFDEKTVAKRHQIKLSYHPLTRQYRLAAGVIQQSFGSLEETLVVLRRLRNWIVVERSSPLQDAPYEVALRMRLDLTLLPKPFQVSALTSRDWHLESPWKRFNYRSVPPVEPRREEADKGADK
ncbi:MAG: DUF4390 domain-containing protein [Betaproteobacteria bacterium]|nr:DUF4390 domain-containing protein [Betaproteobacteria bacterium]